MIARFAATSLFLALLSGWIHFETDAGSPFAATIFVLALGAFLIATLSLLAQQGPVMELRAYLESQRKAVMTDDPRPTEPQQPRPKPERPTRPESPSRPKPEIERPSSPGVPERPRPQASDGASHELALLLAAPLALSEAFSWEETRASLVDSMAGVYDGFLGHLPQLAAGAIILALTLVTSLVTRSIARRLLAKSSLRGSLRELFERLSFIGFWIAGLLLAALVVFPGLTPTKALGGVGLMSMAIGFAFKDIFENFFAGILILWRFPFDRGDTIECEGILGQVEEITIRNTLIRRPTDELVIVPNSKLFTNPVQVLTNRDRRRVTITAGIAYDADIERATQVIEEAVRGCSTVSGSHPVQVFPQELSASSIDLEVAWWARPEPVEMRRSRGEVVHAIKRALDAEGIEIPFPQRVLHVRQRADAALPELASAAS